MLHCEKISAGRSPSVNTEEEWKNLTMEIDLITQDRSILPYMWLSATEGDKNGEIARLDHWPETELVNNQTKKLEANETVWRDFYTGQRLENWTKPYYQSTEDTFKGDTYNCINTYTDEPHHDSWYEWLCKSYDQSCPCSYPAQPLLRLRGLCSPLIHKLFTPKLLYYPINAPLHGSHRLSAPKCPKGHQLEVGSLILMKCD